MRFGIDPFVGLDEIKDYIGITSNTFDEQLEVYSNTTCTLFEHYIGYPLKANTYTDESQIHYVSTYPQVKNIQDVYEVQINGVVLDDPTDTGARIFSNTTEEFKAEGNASIDSRRSKFGTGSLKLPDENSFVSLGDVPENLELKDNDFTVEMWVYAPAANNNATLFEIREDENNLFAIRTSNSNVEVSCKKNKRNYF